MTEAAPPSPRPTFRIGPIPVHVGFGFFLMALLLGGIRRPVQEIAAWVVVVFVAVMVHELGHALAAMRFGLKPTITLHMMGGLTSFPGARTGRWQLLAIAAAGPAAGFLLGGAGLVLATAWAPPFLETHLGRRVVSDFLWANFGWGAINLIPALPWDGGLIVKSLASADPAVGLRRALWVSLLVGTSVAIAALVTLGFEGGMWIAFLFGMSAFQAFGALRGGSQRSAAARSELRAAQEALHRGELAVALELAEQARQQAALGEQRLLADFVAADALLGLGRPEEAFGRCPVDGSEASVLIRREALVALGRHAEAAEEEMAAYRRTRGAHHALEAARAWAQAAERGPALEWLARAAETIDERRTWRDDPAFAAYRDDPAFVALLDEARPGRA